MGAPQETVAAVIERGFTAGVAERIARGTFTYTDRAALLAVGQRLGIDRVRGNAIIADQQLKATVSQRTPSTWSGFGLFASLATFAVVQAGVAVAIVWALKA